MKVIIVLEDPTDDVPPTVRTEKAKFDAWVTALKSVTRRRLELRARDQVEVQEAYRRLGKDNEGKSVILP